MTKKLILGIVLMLSFTMVSCGSQKVTTNNDSSSESSSSTDSETKKEEIEVKDEDTSTQSSETKGDSSTSSTTDSSKDAGTKAEEASMPIYSVDVNTYEPNEVTQIKVAANATIQEKLTAIAGSVSETDFDGLPIEIKSVDTIDGKKVATINLKDSSDKTWVQKFQGSTGGQITSNTLIENFLQTNNKTLTDWIDGVKFLYNNENIEYEHVADLSTVKYK